MAGTIQLALSQQVSANGIPMAGALLYIYQVGTVATPQNAYQDFGLTIPLPNPIPADQTGRIPMFYLADGQVHVRLTDSTGVVIFDYPTMQVIGPSSGGGGGGGSVDPTSVFSTGDFKWRPTTETLTGWVKANAQTIGSATSGATQRANADTQNLFIYLWTYYSNTKCPVSGGRGSTALADFNANKTIGLLDMRSKGPVGLDDMGSTAAGIIQASNVTSGGGDGPTTPAASGGEANHILLVNEMPSHNHAAYDTGHAHGASDSGHQHTYYVSITTAAVGAGASESVVNTNYQNYATGKGYANISIATGYASIGIQYTGGSGAHNNMSPFVLGTWFQKL